jgi:hypothetical protein
MGWLIANPFCLCGPYGSLLGCLGLLHGQFTDNPSMPGLPESTRIIPLEYRAQSHVGFRLTAALDAHDLSPELKTDMLVVGLRGPVTPSH